MEDRGWQYNGMRSGHFLILHPFSSILLLLLALAICFDIGRAQNIVESVSIQVTANPVRLTDTEVSELIHCIPDFSRRPSGAAAQRLAQKLGAHVSRFLDGFPWQPFHHTLGISGYEVYFDHPDEMFYALAFALPFLSRQSAETTKRILAAQLANSPPYVLAGWDQRAGQPRESYEVPEGLRSAGLGKASSAFGVYAFWAYCQYAHDASAAQARWAAVQARLKPLLEADYPFDTRKQDYANDEAERLNGDLAGLIGLARLARLNHDGVTEKKSAARAKELLELRVNLERVNPKILEKSNRSSKHLHYYKLSRYCALVPEVGAALSKWSAGCGPTRLKRFREERNGWYLAFGERMVGGENYSNPLHFSRSLFAGAAFVEQLDADQLLAFVDVPWCQGDFYFMEKCASALWACAGRPWTNLP